MVLEMEGLVVDYKGRPISRSTTGGWTSAFFIIGVEMAERFIYCGFVSNLVSYLTGPLGESTAAGAANVNAWTGVANMLPILGAVVADSWLGRYRTILLASLLYAASLGLLTLSAALLSREASDCTLSKGQRSSCPSPSTFDVMFFFSSLYLVALAQGGHKPCVEAFGADQFDSKDPSESKQRSSFFNWWYFGLYTGTLAAHAVLNYVQDYVGWVLGFGLQCAAMGLALLGFLAGTRTYRYHVVEDKSPYIRIAEVCIRALRNRKAHPTSASDETKQPLLLHESTRSPDHEAIISVESPCSHPSKQAQVMLGDNLTEEELKGLAQLLPIWATCLIYGTVLPQTQTLFTKQGSTMERHIGASGFQIPAASLALCIGISVVISIPIYDFLLVPTARKFTGRPSGITVLQRIGIGLILSAVSMAVAALVEMKRLKTARDFGVVDMPDVPVPMSAWWLAPQYIISGMSEVFTIIGLQEFFYSQMPSGLKSLGPALLLSVCGIGSFLSGFLISTIDSFTAARGEGWFNNNLNVAHLDYFYWLLAGLGIVGFTIYLHFAKSYCDKT